MERKEIIENAKTDGIEIAAAAESYNTMGQIGHQVMDQYITKMYDGKYYRVDVINTLAGRDEYEEIWETHEVIEEINKDEYDEILEVLGLRE